MSSPETSTQLSPEAELLLCCARTRMEEEVAARFARLLRRDLDWDYLLRTASRHGVVPLLHWHLKDVPADRLPPKAAARISKYAEATAARNLFLTRELLKLLEVFAGQGVTAVPFKGPTLAAAAYGNLALRPFTDLDILVRAEDVPRAKEILSSRSYEPLTSLDPAQEAEQLRERGTLTFKRKDGKSLVDLHSSVCPRYYSFPLEISRVFGRLGTVTVGGVAVPTLSREDLLLYLCAHAAKHVYERLEWLSGISELVRVGEGMNWELVLREAVEHRCRRRLLVGLCLAGELLGAPLPQVVQRHIEEDNGIQGLVSRVAAWMFRDGPSSPRVTSKAYWVMRVMDHWADVARCGAGSLILPRLKPSYFIRQSAMIREGGMSYVRGRL